MEELFNFCQNDLSGFNSLLSKLKDIRKKAINLDFFEIAYNVSLIIEDIQNFPHESQRIEREINDWLSSLDCA